MEKTAIQKDALKNENNTVYSLSNSFALKRTLIENLLSFSESLKLSGINIGLNEIIDLFRVLQKINITNKNDFYLASRTALIKRAEDYPVFDSIFNSYWDCKSRGEYETKKQKQNQQHLHSWLPPYSFQVQRAFAHFSDDKDQSQRFNSTKDSAKLVAYSPLELKGKAVLEELNWKNYSKQKRTIRILSRYFATLPGRRFENSLNGALDLRRTIRSSLLYGGELLKISRKGRRISKTKLVILCDVSGSMDGYTTELLLTLQNFCKASSKTEVFAFSTEVARLTEYFRYLPLRKALQTISEKIHLWGSGTRIGHSLKIFNSSFQGLVDHETVVIIISDGWDIGEIDLLKDELAKIHSKANSIIWLNPLVGQPGFEPSTAGMKAALNYVDRLGSTSILNDVGNLKKLLGKSITMPRNNLTHHQHFILR
jgi:uncharacterized protein with von Willebrand factor type A (vWA) domain